MGCAAVVLMGVLSVVWSDLGNHSTGVVAGSGASPGGGGYTQPSVAPMNTGATATWTSSQSTIQVTKAKPPLG